jgi:hypothetical protein
VVCDRLSQTIICADAQHHSLNFEVAETAGSHCIELIMTGKTRQHTRINADGEITDDVFFTIKDLRFEGVAMEEIFCQGRACYTHDFNGNQSQLVDEFYGIIGCNGAVSLEFNLPLFLWLGDYFD